jgi:endoglucanase
VVASETITETIGNGAVRRRFLGGMALMAAGLGAGLLKFGAGWEDINPSRRETDQPAPVMSAPAAPVIAPPAPRMIVHSAALKADWAVFRHLYVTPEGRVIDTGNGNTSHSEGQGWGMMAAQAADDPATFARLMEWTSQHLRCRPTDRLHAWRYKPSDANPVSDLNNATDGDLFIAAALARAAIRWNRPDYAEQAARIARDILGLVRTAGARTVLLPGVNGFDKPDAFVINPSYYAFALFADLAALAPSPLWEMLRRDGTALMLQARYGKWQLPPDWVRVDRHDGGLSIASGWPPRFSYDAIRVPLHLAWAGIAAEPFFNDFRRYWTAPRSAPPAWTDLRTGEEANYPAPAGIRAVATVATYSDALDAAPPLPSIMASNDYYGGGLVLLSRIAAEERALRPF